MATTNIIAVIAYIIFAPFIGGLLEGIDRKLSARMQGRKGPSVFQPFWDVRKLFNKQLLEVNKVQLVLLSSYLFFVLLSGCFFFLGLDMLMIVFSLSTASMFLILSASATHSPYSAMGTSRELAQMMSCEPMELLMVIGLAVVSGSFNTTSVIAGSAPAICKAWGFFIGFCFILTIKFRKSPFDISTSHHAHQEMVKGLTQEFVGPEYGLTSIAEWYENVLLYGFIALFFVYNNPASICYAIIACLVVFFIEVLIDNTSARVKWQLMVKLAWGATIICAGINLLVLCVAK